MTGVVCLRARPSIRPNYVLRFVVYADWCCLLLVCLFVCVACIHTKILDFRGFDSSRILILRGGILKSIGNFPDVSSQQNLSREILSREIGCTSTSQSSRSDVPSMFQEGLPLSC